MPNRFPEGRGERVPFLRELTPAMGLPKVRSVMPRLFPRSILLVVLLALGLGLEPSFGRERTPNLILVLADDLGRECLGCYGGESYDTPHLDRLAREGTRFEACYATPMCSPTRVMLMTGRYNFRNYHTWGKMDLEGPTLARALKEGGYRTAVFGKWHLGGWEEAPYGPTRVGFERFATFDYEKVVREGGEEGNQFWKTEVWEDGKNYRLDGYGPAFYRERVLAFIRDHAGSEQPPFFLYYPLVHAHRPFVPTDRIEATEEERIVRRGEVRHFPGMVEYIDGIVGSLLATLEESGQLDETVILFTADNGTDNVNEARDLRSGFRGIQIRGGKYLPTEMGANVPLLVRGPGVKAGQVLEAPVDFTDLWPTLATLAGIPAPDEGDGETLWPVLSGEPESSHDGLALTWGVYEQSSKKYKDPRQYEGELIHFIRDQRWKLASSGELYDLEADWREENPVPAGAEPEVRSRLSEALQKRRDSRPRLW